MLDQRTLAASSIALSLTGVAAAQLSCGDWSMLEAPAGARAIINVEARSSDDAWAIGYFNPNPKDLIRWDGTTWSAFLTDGLCNEYAAMSIEALTLVGSEHVLVSARASTGPFSSDQIMLLWDGQGWDNCQTLTLEPNIMGAPRNGAPNAIVAPSIEDAWILGQASGSGDATGEAYLVVHWDGSDLTEETTSGGPGNAMKAFRDGIAFASNDIWAVGQYRIIGAGTPGYHASTYHYDGTSWDYIPNPAEPLCCQSTDLNTVAGVAPDDVWAAGSYGIEPLFMHWDGSSWSIVPGPAGATGTIYEMVAIASDDVWAVDTLNGTGFGQFYHWDGTAWSFVPGQEIPGAVQIERHGGLAAVGPCEVWAVGSYNFGTSPVLSLIERLQPQSAPTGDVNGDGTVNFADVLGVIAAWGPCAGPCPADLDGNGAVGFGDILIILANWSGA
ncbi:MAG: hypothetical protein ACYTGP_01900 [Planctomycetota bacterium]|jgi:hypothetical protein